jgi:hypothetical protein
MEARIKEANAVIPRYQAEIGRLQALLASGEDVPPYTQATFAQFQSTLQSLLDGIADANRRSTFANGDTSGFCNITTNPKATSCMKASTVVHETIHQAICKALSPWWKSVFTGTWQQQIGLIGAYQNEIAAYKAEINFLEGQLQVARGQCPISWRGEITRTLIISSRTDSGSPSGNQGGNSTISTWDQTQIDRWTIQGDDGTLPGHISRGTWSGKIDGARTLISTGAFSLGGHCAGTVLHSSSSIKNVINGSGNGKAQVAVQIFNGIAQVSVNAEPNDPQNGKNEIVTTGTVEGSRDIYDQQGHCGHYTKSDPSKSGSPGKEPYNQPSISIESQVNPGDPDVLSDSKTETKQIDGTTTTTTVTLSLHREKHT